MNIALLGFGTVGSHFYKLCEGRTDLHVAAVLSRRPRPELTCTVTADYDEIVRDPSIDIVVEVMGGIEPAYSYLCAAMRAGKHVVTANKQLMCAHFEELTSLAKEKGVALRCTAAAGGGIPWLTSLSRASELDEIKAVEGILNGTTNYMLSAMTNSGADYAPALRKAQELGVPVLSEQEFLLSSRRRTSVSPRPTPPQMSRVWTRAARSSSPPTLPSA